MVSDTRYDFPEADALSPGEVWSIRFPVRVRDDAGAFAAETSFATYSAWAFYVFQDLATGGPSATDRAAKAIVSLAEASGITVGAAPNVDIAVTAAQSGNVPTGRRGYELWATISGNLKRLAYGIIPVID